MRIIKYFYSMKQLAGATMIEMLVYMGILVIFMTALTSIFSSSIDLQLESEAVTSVDRDVQYIFSKLAYDIERSQSIVTPASYGSASSVLTLQIDGSNYTYATASSSLTFTDALGSYNINSYDTTISNLSFTKIGNAGGVEDTVRVSFTLTSTVNQHKGLQTKNFSTTFGKRR